MVGFLTRKNFIVILYSIYVAVNHLYIPFASICTEPLGLTHKKSIFRRLYLQYQRRICLSISNQLIHCPGICKKSAISNQLMQNHSHKLAIPIHKQMLLFCTTSLFLGKWLSTVPIQASLSGTHKEPLSPHVILHLLLLSACISGAAAITL